MYPKERHHSWWGSLFHFEPEDSVKCEAARHHLALDPDESRVWWYRGLIESGSFLVSFACPRVNDHPFFTCQSEDFHVWARWRFFRGAIWNQWSPKIPFVSSTVNSFITNSRKNTWRDVRVMTDSIFFSSLQWWLPLTFPRQSEDYRVQMIGNCLHCRWFMVEGFHP